MPYASNDELPPEIRKAYSGRCQTVFREAFNGHDGSEESKFKVAHTAARKCMESTMTHQPMKAEQIGPFKYRVLAIPFGGEFKGGKDADGEFFSPRTDIKPHWLDERPVLFHHGKDSFVGDDEIGIADDLEQTKLGWFVNVWLNRANRYRAAVEELIARGKMYGSTGPVAHLVKTDRKTGEILVWPYIEQSFTPTPSNRLSTISSMKALEHFAAVGIDVPDDVKAVLTDLEDEPADLRTDLPVEGGDDAATHDDEAIRRLQDAVAQLEALIKRL